MTPRCTKHIHRSFTKLGLEGEAETDSFTQNVSKDDLKKYGNEHCGIHAAGSLSSP